MRTVESVGSLHRMFVSCPRTARHSSHHIPQHGRTENFVYPFAAVAHHAEPAVHRLADAYAATVVQSHEAHSARAIAGETLHSHIRHHVASVFYVRCLAEGRVRAAHIVVVAAQHDGAYLALAHHLIESQGDVHSSHRILIKDARLRADRKSTRLNSSHANISYAVFCLKKKSL